MSESIWSENSVFDEDTLHALLHTPLGTDAKRGALEFTLMELLCIAQARPWGNAARFIADAVPRDMARWDITLSTTWVEKMSRINAAFAKAIEIADGIRKNMSSPKCRKAANIIWHAQIVHPGSPDQDVHTDDNGKRKGRYFTLIVPLTQDPRAGGTYFPLLNHTFSCFGGVLAFDGTVEHAGMGNRSDTDRVFLYAAIFTGKDHN